jgi:hypothetical protein
VTALLAVIAIRHRHALWLVIQAWLLRLLAHLILLAAIAGGLFALLRPHPGVLIPAIFIVVASGRW